jgi:hypothetical protein
MNYWVVSPLFGTILTAYSGFIFCYFMIVVRGMKTVPVPTLVVKKRSRNTHTEMSFQDVGRGGSPKLRTASTSTISSSGGGAFSSAAVPGADDRGHARRNCGQGGGTLGGVSGGGFGQVSDYIVQYQVRRREGNCALSFLILFQNWIILLSVSIFKRKMLDCSKK